VSHLRGHAGHGSHCPKCQANKRDQWLEKQKQDLLPVPYFHIVFTLPHDLSLLVLQNRKLLYGLLLRSSAQTLLEVAADHAHLGAQIGFLSVLHTWGQNLLLAEPRAFAKFLRQLFQQD
jgi:hypothetical protein